MLNSKVIDDEILSLEKKDTSYAVIERLAWLYIVKQHLMEEAPEERTGTIKGSEFLEACSNVPINSVLEVIDKHLESLKIVYPREYENILDKIKGL